VNGPDGCLYILDMYRETIEHPISIPEDIKAFLDLSSGDDRGRIYRLVAPGWKPRPFPKLGALASAELVPHLGATNSWERETAQRLLWERQDKSVVEAVRTMARSGKTPLGRVHALSVLDGLSVLEAADLQAALADPDPHLRERGVWLGAGRLAGMPELAPAILKLATDDSVRVQFAVAYALGEIDSPDALKAMTALATRTPANSDVLEMLTSSIGSRSVPLLDELLVEGASDTPWRQRLLVRAAATDAGVAHVLNRIATPTNGSVARLIGVLGSRVEESGRSLAAIVEGPAVEPAAREKLKALWSEAETTAAEKQEPLKSRLAVVPVILTLPPARFEALLGELLSPQTPPELQAAVIAGFGGLNADLSGPLLAAWPQFGPQLRAAAMTALLRRNARTKALLAAIKAGTIAPSEVDPTARQALLTNPDTGIRELATAAFGTPDKDRQKIIDDYRPALDLAGDVSRGRQAFTKHCAVCHKAEEKGANVGPALTSVTNKSPEDLLVAILDPNRESQAIYQSYTVVTEAGRVLTGILVSDSAAAVTVRQSEGKEESIPRNEIETLKANGMSLMPVGLEKTVAPQDIADVIAFIKSLAAKP
jgi:putative heme-binding domain-containing protein